MRTPLEGSPFPPRPSPLRAKCVAPETSPESGRNALKGKWGKCPETHHFYM